MRLSTFYSTPIVISIILIILASFNQEVTCAQNFNTSILNYNKFPYTRAIWVYWDKEIEKAPLVVRLCFQKMKMVSSEQNWKLTLLTDDNLHQYLTNYTEFIEVKNKMQHPEWKAGLADLIRLSVLGQHGGIWFDLSTILTHGLKWIDNLQKIPYLLTNSQIDNGQQPDLLIPYLNFYHGLSEKRNQQNGKLTKLLPGYQAWFIAAKKNTPIIQQWRKKYSYHINNKEQINLKDQIQNQYMTRNIRGEYLNVDKSINQIIEEKQRQIDWELGLFEQRKNANNQLNIVGFHGEYGPFLLYLRLIPDLDMALTHTLDDLQDQFYITVNFFIKFTNRQRGYFEEKISKLINIFNKSSQNKGIRFKDFEEFIISKPTTQQCKQIKFIVQDSIFGRLIKKNKIAQSYNLYPITKQQQQRWTNYCQDLNKPNNKILGYSQQQQKKIESQMDLQHFWNWLYYYNLITKQTRQEIIKYFTDIQWMGIMSIDLKQLYYWKKIYQQIEYNSMQREQNKNINNDIRNQQSLDTFQIQTTYNTHNKNINNNLKTNNDPSKRYLNTYSQNYQQSTNHNKRWSQLTKDKKSHFYQQSFLAKMRPILIKFWYIAKDILPYLNVVVPIVLYCFFITHILLKYNKNIPNIICNLIKQRSNITKKLSQKCKETTKSIKPRLLLKFISKLVFSIFKIIGNFLIGILFLIFQVCLILKFIRVCIDGDIDYQQFPLLIFILIQISFRHIIYKCLSQNAFIIPGVSLRLLYRIFLPIYYFSFGRCLIIFGEKREQWNFGQMFTVCLIFPVMLKEIELQARKVVQKRKACNIKKTFKPLLKQKVLATLLLILSNITDIIQKQIIVFLILANILPNILYVYYGKHHLIHLIIRLLTKSGMILFVMLVTFYFYELQAMFRQIVKQCRTIILYNTPIKTQQNTNFISKQKVNQIQQKKKSFSEYSRIQLTFTTQEETNTNKLIIVDKENQRPSQTNQQKEIMNYSSTQNQSILYPQQTNTQLNNQQQQFQSQCILKPKIIPHLSTLFILLIKYPMNLYLFYKLGIQPYPQMVYNNVIQIWKPKVSQVLLLLIVNFEIQKVVDELCAKINYFYGGLRSLIKWKDYVKKYNISGQPIEQQEDSRNLSIQQKEGNYFYYQTSLIHMIGLFIFQMLRLVIFEYIFEYFEVINAHKYELKWPMQNKFSLYKSIIIYVTFIGYWLMVFIEWFISDNWPTIKSFFVKQTLLMNKNQDNKEQHKEQDINFDNNNLILQKSQQQQKLQHHTTNITENKV